MACRARCPPLSSWQSWSPPLRAAWRWSAPPSFWVRDFPSCVCGPNPPPSTGCELPPPPQNTDARRCYPNGNALFFPKCCVRCTAPAVCWMIKGAVGRTELWITLMDTYYYKPYSRWLTFLLSVACTQWLDYTANENWEEIMYLLAAPRSLL